MADDQNNTFNELYAKIEAAVSDLTTLKVVTAVGDVNISQEVVAVGEDKTESRSESYQNAKAILSTIDLIDGDIMTVMDDVFATDENYASIREDHLERIKDAQDIVDKNINTLKNLVRTVGDILEDIRNQSQNSEQ